jgi:hypothetical protein
MQGSDEGRDDYPLMSHLHTSLVTSSIGRHHADVARVAFHGFAYKHVFPAINNSPVGTYCWPVYRMPTSLLLVSKVVHEETQDALVQTPLQSLNEHYPPALVSGPYLTVHYSLYVPNTLGYFDPPGHQYDHTYVSRKLA